MQDWFCCDCCLERIESLLLRSFPFERIVLLGEIDEWACDLGKDVDESMIVIAEANETMHLTDILERGPVMNCVDFVLFHSDESTSNAMSSEFHFHLCKRALLELGVEFIFPKLDEH